MEPAAPISRIEGVRAGTSAQETSNKTPSHREAGLPQLLLTYSDGLGFRVDPFDDYVTLFKELKELCALFHYEKLAKDLWPLCGLVNCRKKKIQDKNALTCTRIASLRTWLASFLPMTPAFLYYIENKKRSRALPAVVLRISSDSLQMAAEAHALANTVGRYSTIVQDRTKLNAAAKIICHSLLMRDLNHEDEKFTITVIDVDDPGKGRIPKTKTLQFGELHAASQIAFKRALVEAEHRAGMICLCGQPSILPLAV